MERLDERLLDERLLKVKVGFPNCQGDSREERNKNRYLHLDRSGISEFHTTRVEIYSERLRASALCLLDVAWVFGALNRYNGLLETIITNKLESRSAFLSIFLNNL